MKKKANILLILLSLTGLVYAENMVSSTIPDSKVDFKEQKIWNDNYHLFIEEPSKNLNAAYDFYKKSEFKKASKSIKKAITYIKFEANRSNKKIKDILNQSVKDLKNLSKKIVKKEVSSENELKEIFSKVSNNLAFSFEQKAKKALENKNIDKTSEEIKGTALYLEQRRNWRGKKAKKSLKELEDQLKKISKKLKSGDEYNTENIYNHLDNAEKEMVKFHSFKW